MLEGTYTELIKWHAEKSAGAEPAEAHRQMLVTLGRLAAELGLAKPKPREVMGKIACLAGTALALAGDSSEIPTPYLPIDVQWTQTDASALQTVSAVVGVVGFGVFLTHITDYQIEARKVARLCVAWLERLGQDA